uniref:Uncharacterized protein n=1 Tax=Arundo donax TaxID=35708 RepID=A0A0A8YDZ8_ARUDO
MSVFSSNPCFSMNCIKFTNIFRSGFICNSPKKGFICNILSEALEKPLYR